MPLWMLIKLGLLGQSGYRDIETGGDGGGAGGDGGGATDPQPKESQSEPQPKESNDLTGKSVEELVQIIQDLQSQKSTLLKETMSRKEILKQYGDITPQKAMELFEAHTKAEEEAKKARKEKEEAAQKELENRGKFDAVKKQIISQHNEEVDNLNGQITALKEQITALQSSIVEKSIGENFANSKFLRDEVLLTPTKAKAIYGAHFEINEDGKVVGYDKPKGASDRNPLVDQNGEPIGFEEAISKIISADPEVDSLLRSKMKPGSGSDSKPKPNVNAPQALNSFEKIVQGLKATAK